ncbi:MAG: IS1634 family transposase [Winogradskyella sp.]|uniref:IS1634 family transposase n=1 Tax=Winogradskyella sp. TaxID=1883156 RepID=UPI00185DADDE|nr:IS1634 family transposase [Winogradskyella sp.]NNK23814.1 IS1634 family transposase [Winogradskyella sp.]
MYIRKVNKKNKNSDKIYTYYRLTHSYRIGNKTRQRVLLNLGKLEDLSADKHKALADRIEEILTGAVNFFHDSDSKVEKLAQDFAKKIITKGTFSSKRETSASQNKSQSTDKQYYEVDLQSADELESRDLGGSWVAKQAFERLSIDSILSSLGMSQKAIMMSKVLLTAKMIHPSSELETERWLKENAATLELYDEQNDKATRYQLYKVAESLYTNKEAIEQKLYQVCKNMFSSRSKVVIFDLTNMHFEGMMNASNRAKFGRSKQKRNDCRLISLALTIDSLGFVRASQFWDGNVSEPKTLGEILKYVDKQFDATNEKPLIVFDAGLSTEENLNLVRNKYDYVCVSRSAPKSFTKLNQKATLLKDNRGNEIQVTKVETDKAETLLLVASDQKKKKEESITKKQTERFIERLNYLKDGLGKPRRLKTTTKVKEHVGKIRKQFSKTAKHYSITYQEDKDKGVITDISWQVKQDHKTKNGQYFLRYSKKNLTDKEIWEAYNLTREVEASFRCLKSDLNVRPIFHQKDQYIEAHIWLSILAYQVVNYITATLKEQNIKYSWKTIVEKLKAQRITTTSMNAKDNKKAYIKTCTEPNKGLKKIYEALKFKERPFTRKTKVVTQF